MSDTRNSHTSGLLIFQEYFDLNHTYLSRSERCYRACVLWNVTGLNPNSTRYFLSKSLTLFFTILLLMSITYINESFAFGDKQILEKS